MLKYLLLTIITDKTPQLAPYVQELAFKIMDKKRRGWLVRGIPAPLAETVYNHSKNARTAVAFYCLGRGEIDSAKAWSMADIHDMAEALAEDYIPADNISAGDKHGIEEKVVLEIASHFKSGDEIVALWREFEERKTIEAQVAYNADKMDASVRAVAYRNNFEHIRAYYGSHPIGPLLALYPGATSDDVFDRMLARLDEFHPYNRKVLTLQTFKDALEKVVLIEDKSVYPKYFAMLSPPESKPFLEFLAMNRRSDPLSEKLRQMQRQARYFEF